MLLSALTLAAAGEMIGLRSGAVVRRLHLGGVDDLLGVAVALVTTLLVVWLVGNVAASSRAATINRALERSHILRSLKGTLPDVLSLFARVESFLSERLPGGLHQPAPEPAAADAPPTEPAVRTALAIAGPSTVKVTARACDAIVEGSGFVAAPQLVITNAHVVAGG